LKILRASSAFEFSHGLGPELTWLEQAIGTKGTTGVEAGGRRLKLYLFSHIQGVIHLNPEISDSAFQLGMAEEKLDCTQVTGLAINLGSLRAAQRVRAVRS